MLARLCNFSKGDTLVEVLFAVTIFSLVAIGSISIMNQGTMTAQRSLEITLVRSEMDAQAEALRFIHDSHIAAPNNLDKWSAMLPLIKTEASGFGSCDMNSISQKFIINTKTLAVKTQGDITFSGASTYSQLNYKSLSDPSQISADGIWIEAVQFGQTGLLTKYIDFHIRACWYGPGQSTPMTLGTIVRLYVPAS